MPSRTAGEQFHRFFSGNHRRAAAASPSHACDAVVFGLPPFLQQGVSRLPFVLKNRHDDLANLVEDFRFAFAERHVIGNLIQVAEARRLLRRAARGPRG